MQCPICWANTIGFIGSDCRCGPSPDPEPPINGVTVDGILVTHEGVVVTHMIGAPTNTAPPVVSGLHQIGQTISVSQGAWVS